ncbi:unnamed protein product [Lactuca virosa]|uniref:RING-type domain-containing protein n=1 Tax=Lactuca virosa TaxID=75947 RepID=A0AAU9PMZ4_9ASTR|nr:unnamed protein product [Lactuca virosa]
MQLCGGSNIFTFSLIPSTGAGEERMTENMGPRSMTSTRAPFAIPSSFLVRMAIRISRARWYSFARRVFHYQNGSRSDTGSNPFNTASWMYMELMGLVFQIMVIAYTLSVSKEEKAVWPMRTWVTGYGIGCVLNLGLLFWRYWLFCLNQIGAELPSNIEESRNLQMMNKSRTFMELFFAICNLLGYNMNAGSINRGASEEQILKLPSWKYKHIIEPDLEQGKSIVDSSTTECCICLAKYKENEEMRQLGCSHKFHMKCVDQWLKIVSCCPLCKKELER